MLYSSEYMKETYCIDVYHLLEIHGENKPSYWRVTPFKEWQINYHPAIHLCHSSQKLSVFVAASSGIRHWKHILTTRHFYCLSHQYNSELLYRSASRATLTLIVIIFNSYNDAEAVRIWFSFTKPSIFVKFVCVCREKQWVPRFRAVSIFPEEQQIQ